MRNVHFRTWNIVRKMKKVEKETHAVEPEIWRENRQTRELRNSHGRTWNMARNTEKGEK